MEIIETVLLKKSKQGTHIYGFFGGDKEILFKINELQNMIEGKFNYCPASIIRVEPKEE